MNFEGNNRNDKFDSYEEDIPNEHYNEAIGLDTDTSIKEYLQFDNLELTIMFSYNNPLYADKINDIIKDIKNNIEVNYVSISLYKFLKTPKKYYDFKIGPCDITDIFEYITDNNLSFCGKNKDTIFLQESVESNIRYITEIPENTKYFIIKKVEPINIPENLRGLFTDKVQIVYNKNPGTRVIEEEDEGKGMF